MVHVNHKHPTEILILILILIVIHCPREDYDYKGNFNNHNFENDSKTSANTGVFDHETSPTLGRVTRSGDRVHQVNFNVFRHLLQLRTFHGAIMDGPPHQAPTTPIFPGSRCRTLPLILTASTKTTNHPCPNIQDLINCIQIRISYTP